MDPNWKILMEMGLPLGSARSAQGQIFWNPGAVRDAVYGLSAESLDPTQTDVLAAWLSAFKHHWPCAFDAVLGERGDASLRTLMTLVEPNRYLKLRRIAIENLQSLL